MTGHGSSAADAGRLNVAVDGPAGAGKSTIARMLAERLGIVYIDTGAMYRACAVKALRSGIPLDDETLLERMMSQTRIEFVPSGREQRIYLDGEDVSEAIRTPDATRGSSDIARSGAVRRRLVEMQRGIARLSDVVMDGRDIGSVVLPDAPYKYFLTATDDVRATRRLLENQRKGTGLQEYDEVLSDLRYRDRQDSTRALSPLTCTPDAVLIDTSGMDAEAVVDRILADILAGRTECATP